MINISLAEPSEVVRTGIRAVKKTKQILVNVDEAANVGDMIAAMAAKEYQLLVIEPLLQKGGKETFIRALHRAVPSLKILVFTGMSEPYSHAVC